MRNYIILNNQRSDEISGLIIQELAPISKPLQRTQVETIDGRDGDIVTPLGYAAYDKKITIGLYGDFDINEIIAYFATQGTAIFSNEPDKYYNYQILDQIDYERLVRYRVATVTMHVQPFKYSATEGTITVDSSDTVSDEGSDIALDGTAEAPFNVLRHKGNAIQNGTPTPDNPIDVKVLTGDSTVKITGKNLLDNSKFVKGRTDNGVIGYESGTTDLSYTDDSISFTTGTTYRGVVSGLIHAQPSTEYHFKATTNDAVSRFLDAYDTAGAWISRLTTSASGMDFSFTTPSNCGGVRISFQRPTVGSATLSGLMLELGSTATAYTPYQGQEYVIPFGDTYLAAIGDYADEPVKVGDTWYIRRAIGKTTVSLGSIVDVGTLKGGVFVPSNKIANYNVGAFCTNATYILGGETKRNGVFYENAPNFVFVGATNDTLATLKTKYDGAAFYYVLNTPTDEEVTDQDLIDALDELYGQAHSYKGHTHITATAEDGNAPAVLSVEAGEDNEATVTNAGNTTSRPIITIYGQGDIGVYINDVEVLDIALGNEQYITLDSTEMDAYKDSPANLKNRLVTGDYSKLALNAGANKIRFTGNVTKYEISKYSRWL